MADRQDKSAAASIYVAIIMAGKPAHRDSEKCWRWRVQRCFVWIPSLRAVVGGAVLFNKQHVWMPDTQSRIG